MKQSISNFRDGFRLVQERFAMPQDISGFDPKRAHAIKICDLFLNEKLHLGDIVRMLKDDRGRVVHTLLERHRGAQDEAERPACRERTKATHRFSELGGVRRSFILAGKHRPTNGLLRKLWRPPGAVKVAPRDVVTSLSAVGFSAVVRDGVLRRQWLPRQSGPPVGISAQANSIRRVS